MSAALADIADKTRLPAAIARHTALNVFFMSPLPLLKKYRPSLPDRVAAASTRFQPLKQRGKTMRRVASGVNDALAT
jgi:hypothetical protein